MRADELMIGDWVLYADEGERLKNKPIQVTGIGPDYMQGSFWNGVSDEIVVLSYREIEPIPIDLDILEKTDGKEVQGKVYASNRRTYSPKRMMDGIYIVSWRELQKSAFSTNCKT